MRAAFVALVVASACTSDRRPDEDPNWAATFAVTAPGEAVTALPIDDGGAVVALHLTSDVAIDGDQLGLPAPGDRSNGAVVRLDASGVASWAVDYPFASFRFGPYGEWGEGRHVAIESASGDVWVGGTFWTEPGSWLAEGLDAHASSRGFLHRIAAAGEPGPVIHVGDQAAGAVGAIDAESAAVAAAGWFTDDELVIGDAVIAKGGGAADAWVAAYGLDGEPVWAVGLIGDGDDAATEVFAHTNGAVTAAGRFDGAGLQVGSFAIEGRGGDDGWVARFDADGQLAWAVAVGGSGRDRIDGLVVDAHGRTWIAGWFDGPDLAAGDWVVDRGFASGTVFVASVDPEGNVERLVAYGEDQRLIATDLALDDGRVVLTVNKTGGELRLDGVIVPAESEGFVAALGPDGPVSATVGTHGQVRTTTSGLVLAGSYTGAGRTGTQDLPSVTVATPFVARVAAPW